MSAALVIVYACLAAVEVAVVVAWVVATRRHRWPVRPSSGDVVIGGVTSFLDTLGIGNYAQITALFKLRRHPPDELIPGTLKRRKCRGDPLQRGALRHDGPGRAHAPDGDGHQRRGGAPGSAPASLAECVAA